MIVYYRLCGIPSTNASPIFQEDKMRLNKLCLKSFVNAFKSVKPYIVFICDYCPPEYDDMIRRIVPFKYEIKHTEIGINETMLMSYELAKYSQAESILFAECDYLWIGGAGRAFLNGLTELELVSPYDHLNFYIDSTIHSEDCKIRLINDYHWRSTERNTMTFGMSRKAFIRNYEILKKYGYLDNDVWREMRENGYRLFVPIPSCATHMVRDFLAPSRDWSKLWKTL